jgi:hypothetical protein
VANFLSALESEVLRPIATYVIPGAFLTSALALIAYANLPAAAQLFSRDPTAYWTVFGALTIFWGFIVDSAASHLEALWDDQCDRTPPEGQAAGDQMRDWWEYLRLAFKVEPVGHRYLRIVVMHLKFELNTGTALVVAAPLFWWSLPSLLGHWAGVAVPAIALLVGVLLVLESKGTHALAAKVRHQLLAAPFRQVPAGDSD